MIKRLGILKRFLSFLVKSTNEHGVHSPFAFEFITQVIYDDKQYSSYKIVEEQRKKLLRNNNLIEIVDFGAGSGKTGYVTSLRRVKDIAKRSSISPKQGQLLHRVISYIKPGLILELGTSLGISSIYQVTGSPASFYIGMEGCAATAAIAEKNLERMGDDSNYSMVIGNFDIMLPGVLSKLDKIDYAFVDGNHTYKSTLSYFNQMLPLLHENSVLVFHDIHWSEGMERAWDEITKNPKVTLSIDIFQMGFVFFREGIVKQDFAIRF